MTYRRAHIYEDKKDKWYSYKTITNSITSILTVILIIEHNLIISQLGHVSQTAQGLLTY